ncbi:helix-turn-helix domain-containing protein [Actinomadura atramentaria]|uniref:helix-turn-helix domain-containing protein n=1 Tax=Actinomadura atramentaria TaxID=1990 RepID=UPI00036ED4AA|nr:XRE family transcriptional regulator [Actinomadura atramentaria]
MDEADEPRVGAGIRRRRRALDLTLVEVARRSGLSAPFLSQVENDRARPSMRSLQRIADALDTTAVRLLAAADGARHVDVVRAAGPSALRDGVRPLVRGDHQLHALEFTGEHPFDREFTHRNDEILYVVSGGVVAEADGREYELGPGDTLYCSGGVPHRWRPVDAAARVLLVGVSDHVDVGTADPA